MGVVNVVDALCFFLSSYISLALVICSPLQAFDPPGRGAADKKPLAIYLHHDKSIAANIFPTNVSETFVIFYGFM